MNTGKRPDELEALFEAATGAFRSRDALGRIQPSPAWADLTPAQRERLFDRQLIARLIESGLHPGGLSSTGRTVVERIRSLPQLDRD